MKKRHPSGWRFFYVAVAIGSVGVDAHIDPAVRTVFTEVPGEFVGTHGRCRHRPLRKTGSFQKPRRGGRPHALGVEIP